MSAAMVRERASMAERAARRENGRNINGNIEYDLV
jgi:hypothetical protein